MGDGVTVSRTTDVGVAWQVLEVRAQVAALGLLQPDHIRRVTLYGGDVQRGPVAPGVLLARVVERPPYVEAHDPDPTLVHSEVPRGSLSTDPSIVAGETVCVTSTGATRRAGNSRGRFSLI